MERFCLDRLLVVRFFERTLHDLSVIWFLFIQIVLALNMCELIVILVNKVFEHFEFFHVLFHIPAKNLMLPSLFLLIFILILILILILINLLVILR
jgi:hypothetical protein